ncbi:dynein axonemal intermediate chain 4 [Colletes latitarsis]|uniref:dynein axonemal intermediate chain 4 n=1 Tax=Colletes latitarsis TaxID=2605962 RepID=UPI0040364433
MKADELGILQLTPSNKFESPSSSKLKLSSIGRSRKTAGKNVTSILLQQRQEIRVTDNDIDVTPKLLTHPTFSSIDEHQMTAFEAIGLSQTGSIGQIMSSMSALGSLKRSSSMVIRTSSMPLSMIIADDSQFESFWATQAEDLPDEDVDKAPPQFYLPRCSRARATYERQRCIQVLTKSRGTYLGRRMRRNRGMLMNNWVFHDTFAAPEMMTERDGLLIVHTKESMEQMWQAEEVKSKLPQVDTQKKPVTPEEELAYIFNHINFLNAVHIMERIISNNIFIHAQKRFIGLIKQDPCSLDLEFTYSLDLLWTYNFETCSGRPVSSFRWSYVNKNILAVGYGARANSETKDGLVLIWNAKNPDVPGRAYPFDVPVSDLDWSRDRPNLLAIGFYDGQIKVIDVSINYVNVIRQSERTTSPSSSPQWQVQWWAGDEQFAYQEQIYTCDQDGHIFCYRYVEDFMSTTMMKVFRIEGVLPGVSRTSHCNVYDTSINRSPGTLVLRRHPTLSTIYFVGSDEGCIYKCSTNYLYQHIESFLAHDGPIYSMLFSPFCPKIFLTCGADWCTRIWAEGLTEPLITLSTTMACVRYAVWSPTHSTIIANIVNNEICIWDIKRKTYIPSSVTTSPTNARLVTLDFTSDGNQVVTGNIEGDVYVHNLEGMPFPPYNQKQVLIESIVKALVTKPAILKNLRKLGPPFSQ